ncbi:MAG: hypothetical protein RIG62_27225 [Cyclobacteriaceae bacterium]
MKKNRRYYIRKSHRYLGAILGIQFLLWTVGGLYFSWSSLDEIHGDHLTQPAPGIPFPTQLASPQHVLTKLQQLQPVDSLHSLQLLQVLDSPVYQIRYYTTIHGDAITKTQLAWATTGALRPAISRSEAVEIAQHVFSEASPVEQVEYLEAVGSHHEYRSKPLPAWVITFHHPSQVSVYVAAELGTLQSIRHQAWRTFDFLWMLHTMDYSSRDNFNNWLLRSFALLGLVTILSGFILYYISSPTVRGLGKRGPIKKITSL